MEFIRTREWGFDANLAMSKCLPIEHDQMIIRNPLMTADLTRDKNDALLEKYYKYCDENYNEIQDGYREYMKDIGYGSLEWVSDWYEEYCQESYREVCEAKDLPIFPII